MKRKWTERDGQLAVYNYRHRIQPFPLIVTNIYFYSGCESDALYISRSGHAHEFEVKVTRSDFRADFKKFRHNRLLGLVPYKNLPTTFTYVCPPDIIPVEEIPDYAGLAHIITKGRYYASDRDKVLSLQIIKKAPRRDSKPINNNQWRTLAGKSADRFWSLTLHHQPER